MMEYRKAILFNYHGRTLAGHPGIKATEKMIQRLFNWPGIRTDIEKWIGSCLRCKRSKMGRERQQGEARMHPVLAPMEVIHVDLLSLGQQANGTEIYVLTMIDRCTRWAEACIVKNTSSETIAKKFLKYWVSRFGVPRKIIPFQKVFKE